MAEADNEVVEGAAGAAGNQNNGHVEGGAGGGGAQNEKRCSPKTMYNLCLEPFVRNLSDSPAPSATKIKSTTTVSECKLRLIRFLPPFVLIDILDTVSDPFVITVNK